ncbi:hypothetical protein [Aurantiacibacter hainanensis]|uniref:hypothetical protein n=1 Tax=Aurantiacibacter hainanensis TaxID=3076114 RepID=UPI0030C7618E
MRSIAIAILALTACTQESEPDEQPTTLPADDSAETTAAEPPPEALSPVETLAGEWRVAGIDGEPFDEPYGLALSASEDEIWWEPRCANAAWTYRIDGLTLQTGTAEPDAPVAPGAPPPPVCTVNPPPRLSDVSRALDSAERVGRTPSNGVLLEGGGHSLTLYSQ